MQSLLGEQHGHHGAETTTTPHGIVPIECDPQFASPIRPDEGGDGDNNDADQHVADVLASIRRRREGVDPAAAQGRVYKRLRMRIRHDWTNPADEGPDAATPEPQNEPPTIPEPHDEAPTIPEPHNGEPVVPVLIQEQPQLQTTAPASPHAETMDHQPLWPLESHPLVSSSGPSASHAPLAPEAVGVSTHLESLPHMDVHLPRDHLLLLIPTCRSEPMDAGADEDLPGGHASGSGDVLMREASDREDEALMDDGRRGDGGDPS